MPCSSALPAGASAQPRARVVVALATPSSPPGAAVAAAPAVAARSPAVPGRAVPAAPLALARGAHRSRPALARGAPRDRPPLETKPRGRPAGWPPREGRQLAASAVAPPCLPVARVRLMVRPAPAEPAAWWKAPAPAPVFSLEQSPADRLALSAAPLPREPTDSVQARPVRESRFLLTRPPVHQDAVRASPASRRRMPARAPAHSGPPLGA